MNPLLTQIIIQTSLRHNSKLPVTKNKYSNFELAKGYKELKITVKRHFKDLILIHNLSVRNIMKLLILLN